jgi:phosphatidylglycerophosphatase A
MLLVYFIRPYGTLPVYLQSVIILAIFLLGIPAASEAERYFKKKDPGACVIDEVPGQMVALLLVPKAMGIWPFVAGFFLFRGFDILKPFPIKHLEKAPGGLGIMIDDVGAGLMALGTLHLGIYLYHIIL